MTNKRKSKGQLLNNYRLRPILVFCLLTAGCDPIVKTLGPLSSPSIAESKKRGVFLCEYKPTRIKIFDTLAFDIKEAFVERPYNHHSYNDLSYRISEDKFQVIIVIQKKLYELKYFDTWVVEEFDRSGDYELIKYFQQGNAPDSLSVRVLKVDVNDHGLAGKEDKKEIGSFRLFRKPI